MAGINKVILVGNLGSDPEIRDLDSGLKVATLSLATSESYKDKDGNWQEQTEWHRIVFWRKMAETAENYLKKGSKIYVEGRLRTRSWTDKDNVTRYTTEINGDRLLMLDKREGSGSFPPPPSAGDAPAQQNNQAQTPQNTQAEKPKDPEINKTSEPEDDLPF